MEKWIDSRKVGLNEYFLLTQNSKLTIKKGEPDNDLIPFDIELELSGYESGFQGVRWRAESDKIVIQIVPGGGTANAGIHNFIFNGTTWTFGIEISIVGSSIFRIGFQLIIP